MNFKSLGYTPDDVPSDAKTYGCFEWSFDVSVNSGAKRDESIKATDLCCKEIITAIVYNVVIQGNTN